MSGKFKKTTASRAFVLALVFAVILVVFGIVLLRSFVSEGADYAEGDGTILTYDIPAAASRGDILDRNGRTLVSGKQGFSLRFNAAFFPSQSNRTDRNALIHSLIGLLKKNGEEWKDNLPIKFVDGLLTFEEGRQSDIDTMKSSAYLNLNTYATADNCLSALKRLYKLENYSSEDARDIAAVEYEMWRTGFNVSNPYTFADDVSIETIAAVKEKSDFYRGVENVVVRYREIVDGTVAPHVIGLTGVISGEAYLANKEDVERKLSSDMYSEAEKAEISRNAFLITDTVGKFGLEASLEEYLRGKKGVERISVYPDGRAASNYVVAPVQGYTIKLTIDSGLQKAAERALEKSIKELLGGSLAAAGAVAVVNVNNGEVLASVTYPTFDLSTYYKEYNKLLEQKGNPLINRVLQSVYEPGSTFKPAMACAGLEEDVIDETTQFYCDSVFEYYDMRYGCLSAHGWQDVKQAITNSCNIFFYNVAEQLGIDRMNKYATKLGLGQKTGVELNEAEGILAGRAYRESIGSTWQLGDTIQAGIGQSDNLFTILQLANYCATIANGGTRYACHYVKSMLSSDGKEVISETRPTVLEETGFSRRTLDIVREGMLGAAENGTAAPTFARVKEKVALKTGTTQVKRYVDGKLLEGNNGLNISFAPYDSPEIAIAVIIENVDSGTATADVAADIYNYYFSTQKQISSAKGAGEQVP